MTYAILTCVSLVILIGCWFLYRNNIELFICVLIAISSELFYILPQIYHGPDDYKLLLVPILVVLLMENCIQGKLALGRYGWWMISFLGIALLGLIVAVFSGQSLALGIKAAKFVPLVFVYFLLTGRQIDEYKFTTYFILMSLGVALIAAAQYFVPEGINLFPGMPKDRLIQSRESLRFTVGQFVIAPASVIAFCRYQQSSRLLFLFAAVALFLEMLFIQQTRGFIAAIILSVVAVYALSHKITLLRISIYLIITAVALIACLLLSSYDFNRISLVKRTRTDIVERKGSYQARLKAYKHYWEEIKKRPITGHGILNYNWDSNDETRLRQKGIHLSDIGITHFFVQAGLIGFLWFFYGLSKLWLDILRHRQQLILSSYFIIATFTLPTLDMFFIKNSLFLFSVFLGFFANMIVVAEAGNFSEGALMDGCIDCNSKL